MADVSILGPFHRYSRKNTPAAPIPVPIHIEVTSIYHINVDQRVLSTISESIYLFLSTTQFIETRHNLSYSGAT